MLEDHNFFPRELEAYPGSWKSFMEAQKEIYFQI